MNWISQLQPAQVWTFKRGSPDGRRTTAIAWIFDDIQRNRAESDRLRNRLLSTVEMAQAKTPTISLVDSLNPP
ncbi:hypothetical protein Y032_0040g203 [Ancylostoma ceylanicum]|uniref:Uncharacterized protein n=1 Tax=Ancylostoma ceylanicum TaxID=53326 RepID=A0A016UIN2_9BILA|nr:hypothetical protein Y032_0040g203 [Ancylostoma ceylanicum]